MNKIDIDKIPYKVLIAAEKTIGCSVQSLAKKADKNFEEMCKLAFFNLYLSDQSITLPKVMDMSIYDIMLASGMTEAEIEAQKNGEEAVAPEAKKE